MDTPNTQTNTAPNTTAPAGGAPRRSFGGGNNRGPQGSQGGYRGGQSRGPGQGGRPGGRDSRGPRSYADRPKPEFDQKIISIRRVTRVMAGGRRFSFSVAIAIGDKKGSVGVGTGKATDTALAIGKALKTAKKSMITVNLNKSASIPHDVDAKFSTSRVVIMPNKGRGLVAGSSVRDILNLAGIKDVNAKILSGSKNKLNNARATMKALSQVAKKKIVTEPAEFVRPDSGNRTENK